MRIYQSVKVVFTWSPPHPPAAAGTLSKQERAGGQR